MRVKYLDYVKAIGIFLVILEHVIASYVFMQPVTVGILAFHMPLFFVISGVQYSLKEKADGLSRKFIGKRVKRLLIPYAVFAACILLYKIPFTLITEHQITYDFVKYMTENIFVTGYGVGWFLVALFYAEILFSAAFCTEKRIVHVVAAMASCILGIVFSFGGNVFLKLISRVFISSTFLWAGYFAGKWNKLLGRLPAYALWGIFALSAVLSQFNGQCSMLDVRFGASRLLFLYNAIAMSLSFIGIVKQLERKELPFLRTIGVHTLSILLTHTYVITAIKYVSYLVLPRSLNGDILSVVLQLAGTFAVEIILVWMIITIHRKQNKTKTGMA